MANYKNGSLYEIYNDIDNRKYIGSTVQTPLCRRMGDHRKRSHDTARTTPLYEAMRLLGPEHFSIRLIKANPCKSKDELETAEYDLISQYQKDGEVLLNRKVEHHKAAPETIEKCRARQMGSMNNNFKFGNIHRLTRMQDGHLYSYWIFTAAGEKAAHFSVMKFGDGPAQWMAEQARKVRYPQYLSDEERVLLHMGAIDI